MPPLQRIRYYRLDLLFILAIVCLLLLLACGGGSPPEAQRALSYGISAAPQDSMHLRDSTLQRLGQQFDDNFNAGTNIQLLWTEQEWPWAEFAALIPSESRLRRAVRFDYGLHHDSIRFGISVVELDTTLRPNEFTYKLPDSLFHLAPGGFEPWDGGAWRAAFQYDPENSEVYFSKVNARPAGSGGFEKLDYGTDVQAEVLAWEDELLPLYTENANGHPDSTMYMVIRCIARADADGRLQQRMGIYLRLRANSIPYGPPRDLLDDRYYPGLPFRMHGADLGTMCPPMCAEYLLVPR